jgi:hypothetical protein
MIRILEDRPVQPEAWTVVFDRKCANPWVRALCWRQKYRHVSAYAYVPGLAVWVFYNVRLYGTDLVLCRDGATAKRMIAATIATADLVCMRRREATDAGGMRWRWGFYCVPAVKHLLGLKSTALRPDALFRDCVAAGGEAFEADSALNQDSGLPTMRLCQAPSTSQNTKISKTLCKPQSLIA